MVHSGSMFSGLQKGPAERGHVKKRQKVSKSFRHFSTIFAQGKKRQRSSKSVRDGFWQNGFFADFYFWAAGFFRGFCRRIFSPHFCGKKCAEKSSRKIPGKILQNLDNKNPRHISAEGPGQKRVKNVFDTFRQFSRGTIFWPLLGGSDSSGKSHQFLTPMLLKASRYTLGSKNSINIHKLWVRISRGHS